MWQASNAVTLCLFAESIYTGLWGLPGIIWTVSAYPQRWVLWPQNGSRLCTEGVLCKASETSTELLTERSSWLGTCSYTLYPVGVIHWSSGMLVCILLYPAGFMHWSNGMFLSCTFYPSGFIHWSSDMLLSYTTVSCRCYTLVQWHVTFVYFCIL